MNRLRILEGHKNVFRGENRIIHQKNDIQLCVVTNEASFNELQILSLNIIMTLGMHRLTLYL